MGDTLPQLMVDVADTYDGLCSMCGILDGALRHLCVLWRARARWVQRCTLLLQTSRSVKKPTNATPRSASCATQACQSVADSWRHVASTRMCVCGSSSRCATPRFVHIATCLLRTVRIQPVSVGQATALGVGCVAHWVCCLSTRDLQFLRAPAVPRFQWQVRRLSTAPSMRGISAMCSRPISVAVALNTQHVRVKMEITLESRSQLPHSPAPHRTAPHLFHLGSGRQCLGGLSLCGRREPRSSREPSSHLIPSPLHPQLFKFERSTSHTVSVLRCAHLCSTLRNRHPRTTRKIFS